jgi:GT2 family glycosyltransferase
LASTIEFSVVVPTYGRPARLQACLAALAGLDFPPARRETLVVDDGSGEIPQPVREAIAAAGARLVVQAHAGPAAARNTGAGQAQGRFLAFTDDDCLPEPAWLDALAEELRRHPDDLIGGRTINGRPGNLYAAASQDLIDLLYAQNAAAPGRARFFTSNNLALSAERFLEIGGFNHSFHLAAGEDRELCDRWQAAGLAMRYASQAVVLHQPALTMSSFWRQHFNYGRGAVQVHRLRAKRGWGQAAPEGAGFYWQLLSGPFQPARLRRTAGLRIALLTVVSQAATAAGYLREAWFLARV